MTTGDLVLWIGRSVLALAFVGSGAMKLLRSRQQLMAMPPMGWSTDFSAAEVKLIGLAEVVGAMGLVLPGVLDVAPRLATAAAAALALLMAGAVKTHRRRRESAGPATVLGVLSALVGLGLTVS